MPEEILVDDDSDFDPKIEDLKAVESSQPVSATGCIEVGDQENIDDKVFDARKKYLMVCC